MWALVPTVPRLHVKSSLTQATGLGVKWSNWPFNSHAHITYIITLTEKFKNSTCLQVQGSCLNNYMSYNDCPSIFTDGFWTKLQATQHSISLGVQTYCIQCVSCTLPSPQCFDKWIWEAILCSYYCFSNPKTLCTCANLSLPCPNCCHQASSC